MSLRDNDTDSETKLRVSLLEFKYIPAWSISQKPQREDSRRKPGQQGQGPDDTLSNLEGRALRARTQTEGQPSATWRRRETSKRTWLPNVT